MISHDIIPLDEIKAAYERTSDAVVRTPLIKLNYQESPADIYLKLENLQPINSFKIRGAGNKILSADKEILNKGVWTASAGNMAQAVGWYARELGLKSTVVVPDFAQDTKLERIRQLGCEILKVPFADWFNIISTHQHEGLEGLFVHPVSDPAVMAGNGTIGLEIFEDLPDVDTVITPYGLGGLSCGIASAFKSLNSAVNVYACETASAAPFSAALAAGEPVDVGFNPSFVDSMGTPCLLPEMWELASQMIDTSIVSSLEEIAFALRVLIECNRIVAEGAGAASVAAALSGKAGGGKIVCVISGGNIDSSKLTKIIKGEIPD
ncbi:threonine ammonia-lyase [Aliikangiella sp. IMCC44359]|uniref:threonine ammonia-lyase n=1 Tax=Aliikangiella sp. IMCC44359 TaxID=3459125 RepID=UPI00403B117E